MAKKARESGVRPRAQGSAKRERRPVRKLGYILGELYPFRGSNSSARLWESDIFLEKICPTGRPRDRENTQMQNRARIFVLDRLSEKTDRDVNEPAFVNCRLSTTGIDSLDVMELLTEIEDEFAVRFEDTTVTAETTVQQVIDFIVTKTG